MNKTGMSISMLCNQNKNLTGKDLFNKIRKLSQLNKQLLDSCPGIHDFSIELKGTTIIQTKWECSVCGGEVSTAEKLWYEKGVEHGQLHSSS